MGVGIFRVEGKMVEGLRLRDLPKDQDSDNQRAHITNVFGCGRRHDFCFTWKGSASLPWTGPLW